MLAALPKDLGLFEGIGPVHIPYISQGLMHSPFPPSASHSRSRGFNLSIRS